MRDPQEILKELYLDMTKTNMVLSKHEFHEFKTWLQFNQNRCESIRYSDDKIEFPYFAVDRTVTLFMEHNETLIQQIALEVEREFQSGGLSSGIYMDFAMEVAKRYAEKALPNNISLKELKQIRNYFGENDKTLFEHKAFAILDSLVKKHEN